MTAIKLARELLPGDKVDLERFTLNTPNETIAAFEFAVVSEVNHFPSDSGEPQVIIHTANLAVPVIIAGNTPLPVDVNGFE